jgi:hypothetical protein
MSQQAPRTIPTPVITPEPGGGIGGRIQEYKNIMDTLYPKEEKTDFQKVSEGLGGLFKGVAEGIRAARGDDMAGDRLGQYLQQMRGREEGDRMESEKSFIRTLILADLFNRPKESAPTAKPEVKPKAGQQVSYVSPARDLYQDVAYGLDRNMVEAYGPLAGLGFFNARNSA